MYKFWPALTYHLGSKGQCMCICIDLALQPMSPPCTILTSRVCMNNAWHTTCFLQHNIEPLDAAQ